MDIFPSLNTAAITGGTATGLAITGGTATGLTNIGTTSADSSGTPGNQTSNTPSGRCSIAAAGTAVTVTNNLVTAASRVFYTLGTNDATAAPKNVVPGAGSFVITLSAATTGITNINWFVVN